MGRTITVWAIVFLVVLRLAISWQFFMEGSQKVRSNYVIGTSEISKPFSSEGYFRGSTGPFAGLIRGQLPDPDEQLLALVRLPEGGTEAPAALSKAWADYHEAFLSTYQLQGKELDRAAAVAKQARANYVEWLTSLKDADRREVERKFSGNTATLPMTTRARIDEWRRALKDYREYDNIRWKFGRDIDKEDQALARAKLTEYRTALRKDVDDQTDKYRKALADIVRARLDATLVVPATPDELVALSQTPEAIEKRWPAVLEEMQTALKLDKAQVEMGQRMLERSRQKSAASWNEVNAQGTRVEVLSKTLATAPAEEQKAAQETLAKATDSLRASIKSQDDQMKAGLEEMLTESQKSVTPPRTPEGWTFIKTLDLVTICLITGSGLLLMLGLFTRTACILAASFLLLTFLSAPPFPWLPLPPGTEGNPVYVNKNLIEFFALLVLAGTMSGRWFGIDALLHWMFGKPETDTAGEPTPSGVGDPGR